MYPEWSQENSVQTFRRYYKYTEHKHIKVQGSQPPTAMLARSWQYYALGHHLVFVRSCHNSMVPVNCKWRDTTVSLGSGISTADKLFASGDKLDYRFTNKMWNSSMPNHNFIEIYLYYFCVYELKKIDFKNLFPLTFHFVYIDDLTNEKVLQNIKFTTFILTFIPPGQTILLLITITILAIIHRPVFYSKLFK
jgi:hypothetical protein